MSKDFTELRVKRWLEDKEGHTNVRDLSKDNLDPPDFEVDGCIGVEARRLNWMTGDENRGLESVENPLEKDIKAGLESAGEPPHGCKVYVSCDLFYADLPAREVVIREVKLAAIQFIESIREALQDGHRLPQMSFELNCGMSICFDAFEKSSTGFFEVMDVQAGTVLRGLVIKDSIDNINRCIVEKTDKIKVKIHQYREWWLVLVDYNIYTPGSWEQAEWQTIKDELVDTKPWSRIVVISRMDELMHTDLIEQPTQD